MCSIRSCRSHDLVMLPFLEIVDFVWLVQCCGVLRSSVCLRLDQIDVDR